MLDAPKTLWVLQSVILQSFLYPAQQLIGARFFGAANLLCRDRRFPRPIQHNADELCFLWLQPVFLPVFPVQRGIFRAFFLSYHILLAISKQYLASF